MSGFSEKPLGQPGAFDRPKGGWVDPINDMSTTIICNSILPAHERTAIEEAAWCAFKGWVVDAEEWRFMAGYGSLRLRRDADCAVK